MRLVTPTALFVLLATAFTAPAGVPVLAGEKITLPSKVLGEERTLWVSVPDSYARTARRYPVLYLTDAESQFGHTAATAAFLARNGFMPEVIVVGIQNTDRTRDLSPSHDPQFPTSGGADRFLEFIETELVPFVESGFRTAPFRIFAGHSAGGNFAFHALRARPDLFQAVIAVSPWLVWDKRKELALLTPFLAGGGARTRALFFTSGDEGPEMRDVLAQVTSALKAGAPKSLRWASANYPGENHGSVVLPSHYAALRMIFDGWSIPVDPKTERLVGSLDDVKKRYDGLSTRLGFPVTAPEVAVNRLGYQALAEKNVPAALSFFRYNAATYPESPNVHDSLGDGLEAAGSLEEALASHAKAADLGEKSGDPNTPIFKANAERLKARIAAQAAEKPAAR
ncbi:MAG TPA: alpha/beta hydrolase-fold protein [Thermoanaerobaculia bacterium]|nr:alpha/beta hydrolase-fold protein [Thermoanaerobaculia bacterium]